MAVTTETKAVPKQVCVESKFAGVHMIAIGDPPKDAKTLYTPRLLQLLPGNNVISGEEWAKARDNEMTKSYLKKGKTHKLVDLGPEFLDLSAASEEDAVERIENTIQNDLLKTWHMVEKRVKVRDALERRIKDIDVRTPDDEPGAAA